MLGIDNLKVIMNIIAGSRLANKVDILHLPVNYKTLDIHISVHEVRWTRKTARLRSE